MDGFYSPSPAVRKIYHALLRTSVYFLFMALAVDLAGGVKKLYKLQNFCYLTLDITHRLKIKAIKLCVCHALPVAIIYFIGSP